MTLIDWVIVGFVVLLAIRGFERGFIVGALSLAGFVAGAVIGSRVAPLLLSQGSQSPFAPLFGLGGALVLGSLIGSLLERLGYRGTSLIRWIPGFKLLDGLLGAVLTALIGFGIVWIIGAVLVQTLPSDGLREDVQDSKIITRLDDILPPSGPILQALARIDPLPSITGPSADVPPPTRGIIAAEDVRQAASSVVRITGQACGVGIEGSGWVGAPDVVVTNAHVVAGESDPLVQLGGVGVERPTRLLLFDPHNDVAVLRVPGLNAPVLPLEHNPAAGTTAAILGFPEDGPLNVQPGRLGETRLTATANAYGRGPVLRQISSLRGLVRPGNSGGPLVDASGHVLAMVYATLTGTHRASGGLAVPSSVVSGELDKALAQRGSVSSGPCTK